MHFQEDEAGDPERFATFEVENRFYNYKAHGHHVPQMPTVVCWEVGNRPKLSVKQTQKPFKYVVSLEEATLRIFALSKMPGVFIATDADMSRRAANQTWSANL